MPQSLKYISRVLKFYHSSSILHNILHLQTTISLCLRAYQASIRPDTHHYCLQTDSIKVNIRPLLRYLLHYIRKGGVSGQFRLLARALYSQGAILIGLQSSYEARFVSLAYLATFF